jgi:hypothetical protein
LCTGHAFAVACFQKIPALTTAIRTAMPVISNLGVNMLWFSLELAMEVMPIVIRLSVQTAGRRH